MRSDAELAPCHRRPALRSCQCSRTTRQFAYLRQSVRTNNAAVVAEGAVKPTSVYSVVRVEESLAVIAHLSEGVPRYWFVDNAVVQGFLANELDYGLRMAVEAKVPADINATSGTQAQAYSTSPLATLRKSLTLLESAGYEPGYVVLDPVDWEGIELALAATNAIDYQGIPYDAAARRLFGVPVVVAIAQTVASRIRWRRMRWHLTPTRRVRVCSGRRPPTPMTGRRTSSAPVAKVVSPQAFTRRSALLSAT
jgi:hypothetical protein